MEAVNLVVGIIAILLAIGSVLVSLKLSNDASRSLDQAKATLEDVRRETSNITRAVEDRLSDLINRVAPSVSDQMGVQFASALLKGDIDIGKLEQLAKMAEKMKGLSK